MIRTTAASESIGFIGVLVYLYAIEPNAVTRLPPGSPQGQAPMNRLSPEWRYRFSSFSVPRLTGRSAASPWSAGTLKR